MTVNKYLLGIDIGSYESKGVITTLAGKVLAYASVPHVIDFPHSGWAEQDADLVWWHDFKTLSRQLIQQAGIDARQIAAVGASATAQCVVPLDGDGHPLMPAILYGIDSRAEKEVGKIEEQFGAQKILDHCGHRVIAQDLGPRLLWIKMNRPEVYEKTASVLTSSSYLVYRLTGEKVIDIYTAFDSAPMFDIHQYRYLTEMTGDLIDLEKLPKPIWSTEIAGTVTSQAALETGLAVGTPVIAGTADAASEALSAGLAFNGDLMIMYGSSTFFILKTDRLITSETLWGDSFLEPNTFAVAAGMAVGGSLTRWYRDNFAAEELAAEKAAGKNAYAALAKLAGQSTLGANGLVMLPYFSGERTPFYDPAARGMLFGLTLTHTRADIYRAILESIGYGIRHNIEAMQLAGLVINRYLAVGGGINNRGWLQIVSDILGQSQLVPDQPYGACYGDAFMAGVGIGEFASVAEIDRWVQYSDTIQPDLANTRAYDRFYKIYRNLYGQTADLMHELTELQRAQL
jgi:xylulokinase